MIRTNRRFTLLELLVAMAVFSVMITVLMQFFSSAQKVSIRTGTRTEIFESGRVAMELIARDLKSAYYGGSNSTYFMTPTVTNKATNTSSVSSPSLTFNAYSQNAPTSGQMAKLSYFKTVGNELVLSVNAGPQAVIAKNVKSVSFTALGGNKAMPDTIEIELQIRGKDPADETQDLRVFTKTVYIGQRGQHEDDTGVGW